MVDDHDFYIHPLTIYILNNDNTIELFKNYNSINYKEKYGHFLSRNNKIAVETNA